MKKIGILFGLILCFSIGKSQTLPEGEIHSNLVIFSDTANNYVISNDGDTLFWRFKNDRSGVFEFYNKDSSIHFLSDIIFDEAIQFTNISENNGDTILTYSGDSVYKIASSDLAVLISYWKKTGNYLYPKILTDSIGIGLNNPNNLFQVKDLIDFNNNSKSISLGYQAGNNNNQDHCVFLGYESGNVNNNIRNTFIGYQSGKNNNIGYYNTYLGWQTGLDNTSGNMNTFIGYFAGNDNLNDNNTYIGTYSGDGNTNGSNNIFLGYYSGASETGSNKLYIENSDANSLNALIYGEFDNSLLRFNSTVQIRDVSENNGDTILTYSGDSVYKIASSDLAVLISYWKKTGNYTYLKNITDSVGIGTNTPSHKLDVTGNINSSGFINGNDSITSNGSITIGSRKGSVGVNSAVFGGFTTASGQYSFASGVNTTASGYVSFASGNHTTASGVYSFTNGNYTTASGTNTTASGTNTTASGNYSFTAGDNTKAQSQNEFAIGYYNDTIPGANATVNISTDHLFVIGNGVSDANRNNALTVLKNGNSTFDANLTVNDTITVGDSTGASPYTKISARNYVQGNTGNSIFIGEGVAPNDDLTDNHNVFIGNFSGANNTSEYDNVYIGYKAGGNVMSGKDFNAFLGSYAGYDAKERYSVAIGYKAGYLSGLECTYVGTRAGDNNIGNYNTVLGFSAGYFGDGHYNVFIGHKAGYNETGSSKLYIENSDAATPLIYGDFATNKIIINGELTSKDTLHVGNKIKWDETETYDFDTMITIISDSVLVMNTRPQLLISAIGAGTHIQIIDATIFVNYNSAQYIGDNNVSLTNNTNDVRKFGHILDDVMADAILLSQDVAGALTLNQSIYITNDTGDFTNGDSPITVWIRGSTIKFE